MKENMEAILEVEVAFFDSASYYLKLLHGKESQVTSLISGRKTLLNRYNSVLNGEYGEAIIVDDPVVPESYDVPDLSIFCNTGIRNTTGIPTGKMIGAFESAILLYMYSNEISQCIKSPAIDLTNPSIVNLINDDISRLYTIIEDYGDTETETDVIQLATLLLEKYISCVTEKRKLVDFCDEAIDIISLVEKNRSESERIGLHRPIELKDLLIKLKTLVNFELESLLRNSASIDAKLSTMFFNSRMNSTVTKGQNSRVIHIKKVLIPKIIDGKTTVIKTTGSRKGIQLLDIQADHYKRVSKLLLTPCVRSCFDNSLQGSGKTYIHSYLASQLPKWNGLPVPVAVICPNVVVSKWIEVLSMVGVPIFEISTPNDISRRNVRKKGKSTNPISRLVDHRAIEIDEEDDANIYYDDNTPKRWHKKQKGVKKLDIYSFSTTIKDSVRCGKVKNLIHGISASDLVKTRGLFLIVDELHNYKNGPKKTQRGKAMQAITSFLNRSIYYECNSVGKVPPVYKSFLTATLADKSPDSDKIKLVDKADKPRSDKTQFEAYFEYFFGTTIPGSGTMYNYKKSTGEYFYNDIFLEMTKFLVSMATTKGNVKIDKNGKAEAKGVSDKMGRKAFETMVFERKRDIGSLFVRVVDEAIIKGLGSSSIAPSAKQVSMNTFYATGTEVGRLISTVLDEIQLLNDILQDKKSKKSKSGIFGKISIQIKYLDIAKTPLIARQAAKVLKDPKTKVVIFSKSPVSNRVMARFLQDFNPIIIDGSVKIEDRQSLIEKFQRPDFNYRVMISNITVTSTGVDFDDKSGYFTRTLFINPDFRIIEAYQGLGRVVRADSGIINPKYFKMVKVGNREVKIPIRVSHDEGPVAKINFVYVQGTQSLELRLMQNMATKSLVLDSVSVDECRDLPFPGSMKWSIDGENPLSPELKEYFKQRWFGYIVDSRIERTKEYMDLDKAGLLKEKNLSPLNWINDAMFLSKMFGFKTELTNKILTRANKGTTKSDKIKLFHNLLIAYIIEMYEP